jgi:hypothetical protein
LGAIGLFLSARTHNTDEDGFFVALCFVSLFYVLCSISGGWHSSIPKNSDGISDRLGCLFRFGFAGTTFFLELGIYKYLLMGSVVLAAPPTLITDIWKNFDFR